MAIIKDRSGIDTYNLDCTIINLRYLADAHLCVHARISAYAALGRARRAYDAAKYTQAYQHVAVARLALSGGN